MALGCHTMNKARKLQASGSKPRALTVSRATNIYPPTGTVFHGKDGRAGPDGNIISKDIAQLMLNNREWSKRKQLDDPDFFNRLSNQQSPEYLWVGCADSRVPANVVVGLDPGEVFVQRNVGNQALHNDMNCMACIEFAVKALKVKTVIVSGHYACGAVKAALRWPAANPGLCNMWISDIREARNQHIKELSLLSQDDQVTRLCEINVMRQVFHVATSPPVQEAWANGQPLSIFGIIYGVGDGLVKELVGPLRGNTDINMDPTKFEERQAANGPIKIADSANPLDTKAMVEKLTLHSSW